MSEIPSPDKVMLESTYSDKYGKEQVEKLNLPSYLHMYRGKPIKAIVPKDGTGISEGDEHFVEWYIDVLDFQLRKSGWTIKNYSHSIKNHIFIIDRYVPPPPPEPTFWEKIRSWWYEASRGISKEKKNQDQNTQNCIPD